MRPWLKRTGVLLAVLSGALCAAIIFLKPKGIAVVEDKWSEIRELQQANAELEARVAQLRHRVDNLAHNRTEQQLEIRKHLKMLRKGETLVVLGDQPGQVTVPAVPSPTPAPAAAPEPTPAPRRPKPSQTPASGLVDDSEPPQLPTLGTPAALPVFDVPPPEAPPPGL